MLTYYRRRKRGMSKIGEIVTYIRRRRRVNNRKEGGREREEKKGTIVQKNSNKRGREEGNGVSVQEERPVKKERTIAPCCSPRASYLTPHSTFNCHNMDMWTEVAKHLDGREPLMLSFTYRWFNHLVSEDYVWKYACLRDMGMPAPRHVSFPWKEIYAAAFDGSHAYCFRQQDKHIDWMRIGSFYLDSPYVLLTETLSLPRRVPRPGTDANRSIQLTGTCSLTNAKTGIWIADLQLVRWSVCNLNTCEGTMQVLDARHMELFLEDGYLTETWQYEEIGSNRIPAPSEAAVGGIFDLTHLSSSTTAKVLDTKSWVGPPTDWQPKAKIGLHAVAVNTNLQPNDGITDIGYVMDRSVMVCPDFSAVVQDVSSSIIEPLVSTCVRRPLNVHYVHDDLYAKFPWILQHRLVPYDEVNLEFYSLPFDTVYHVPCPEALGKRLFCDIEGYMLCQRSNIDQQPTGAFLSLINPLTHDEIVLPPYNLSNYPHTRGPLRSQLGDFVLMFGILGTAISTIPLSGLSQPAWNEIDLGHNCASCRHFCLRGMLFSEDRTSGVTMVTELATGNLVCSIPAAEGFVPQTGSIYILEAFGSILRVLRRDHDLRWIVYKLDYGSGIWERTADIGNVAIFLDTDGGFALRASQVAGIKNNFIYHLDPGSDVQLVRISDCRVKTLRYPWQQIGYWFRPNIHRLSR